MNKNESIIILKSLAKIVSKDPIISVSENETDGSLIFTHLSNKTTTYKNDIDFSLYAKQDDLEKNTNKIKTLFASVDSLKDIQSSLKQSLEQIRADSSDFLNEDDISPIVLEIIKSYDYNEHIQSYVNPLLNDLTDSIGNELYSKLENLIDNITIDFPSYEKDFADIDKKFKTLNAKFSKLNNKPTKDYDSEIENLKTFIDDIRGQKQDLPKFDFYIKNDRLFVKVDGEDEKDLGLVSKDPKVVNYSGVDGESAYKIARRYGYKGTESEFANCLINACNGGGNGGGNDITFIERELSGTEFRIFIGSGKKFNLNVFNDGQHVSVDYKYIDGEIIISSLIQMNNLIAKIEVFN